jgi:hypothetical protein
MVINNMSDIHRLNSETTQVAMGYRLIRKADDVIRFLSLFLPVKPKSACKYRSVSTQIFSK